MPISEAYNMDCMEYMKQFPDKHFELAIVDPPYGLNIINKHGKVGATGAKKWDYKDWDSSCPSDLYFIELFRVSKNQIVWGANHFIEQMPAKNSSCWIVWDKMQRDFSFADGELAWTSFKTAVRFVESSRGRIVADGKIHPTQKPIYLYKWLLTNYAKQGDKILDTHLGSGSSRIAAYHLGFDFYGTELDPDYFAAMEKRFKEQTMQQQLFTGLAHSSYPESLED